MKTILVTGGTGLVGTSIHNILHQNNKYHKYLDSYRWIFSNSSHCDLRNYEDTVTYITSIHPDIIIHLAACVGGLYKNINHKQQMFEDNSRINFNVLFIANQIGVSKVLSCLSTCVYPDKVSYPIVEECLHNGEPHSSNYPYAYAKRFLEIQSRIYNEMGKTFLCVIPTNIYGPHDQFSLEHGHVIPSLIHKIYLAKQHHKDIVSLRGDGSSLRQFLYVDDLSKVILSLLFTFENAPHKENTYIVAPNIDSEISIYHVSKLISNRIGYKGDIICDTVYKNGQYRKTASNEKLRKSFPDISFTTIEDGLQRTIEWFVKHYPNVRGRGAKI